jgi:hypothetical protein
LQISRCFGFSFVGALRGGAKETAVSACACISETQVYPMSGSVPAHHWHVCALVSVCLCERERQGERVLGGDKWTIIIIQNRAKKELKKQKEFVALGVHSVALRHTLVYVWETLLNWSQRPVWDRFRMSIMIVWVLRLVEFQCRDFPRLLQEKY